MGKFIKEVFKNETLSLSECTDGFWLYDETRGMNISMRAKTEQSAFIEALMYYQERLQKIEAEHKSILEKVNAFIAQINPEEE